MRNAGQRGAEFIQRSGTVYLPFTRRRHAGQQGTRVCAVARALLAGVRRLPEAAGGAGRGSKQPDTPPRI
jgi:hypothetical protein